MKIKIILPFIAIALMLSAFGQKSIIQSPITSIESNSNMQLDSGLVAYYPFNGNANDESGNANNGSVNGATLTSDRFGNSNKAYSFNGIDNYIVAEDNDVLHITSQISIAGWMYKYSDVAWSSMVTKGETYDDNEYTIQNDSLNSICFTSKTGGLIAASSFIVPINGWHFIVMTWDGSLVRFYFDGVLDYSSVTYYAGPLPVYNSRLYMGFDPPGSPEYFHGKLDDIRIYNRALSEAEIQQLYNEGGGPNVEISGTITDPNGNPVNGGNVYLFNSSNLFGGYDTTDITTITNGTFTNNGIANSPSILLAFPDSSHLSSMLPTYYGDTIYWMGADTILTSVNLDLGTIKFIPRPPSPNGNATISGRVVSNLYTKANDPIDNVGIILKKNSKGSSTDYTLSDANGLFSFRNVEVGNYSIFVDYPGIRMYTNGGANNVSIVNPDDSIQITARVDSAFIRISGNIGIFNSSSRPNGIIMYPNPTTGLFTLAFENPGREKVTVSISSIDGRLIYSNEFIPGNDNNFKKVIDLQNFVKGIYIVKIQTKQRADVKSLIVN